MSRLKKVENCFYHLSSGQNGRLFNRGEIQNQLIWKLGQLHRGDHSIEVKWEVYSKNFISSRLIKDDRLTEGCIMAVCLFLCATVFITVFP